MSFLPDEEIKNKSNMNLAPMIDFLFLMLMFFASLAVSRATTKDTDIDLVKISDEATNPALAAVQEEFKTINININAKGEYKWVTDLRDYAMVSPAEVYAELNRQYDKGLLPEKKEKTQVLVKIDKAAAWEPILKLIFAVKDAGFEIRPVYDQEV